MANFKDRLIYEKNELDKKAVLLSEFMNTDTFVKLEGIQKSLLNIQIRAMQTYSNVLGERLIWLEKLGG